MAKYQIRQEGESFFAYNDQDVYIPLTGADSLDKCEKALRDVLAKKRKIEVVRELEI